MGKRTNTLLIVQQNVQRYIRSLSILIAIGLFTSLLGNIVSIQRAQNKIVEAEKRVKKLQDEHAKLSDQLQIVESEEYKEIQLRDKLGMAKEGEIVLVMPSDEIVRKLAPKQEEYVPTLPEPNWKKWLNLFM